jgi:C-terminal processing protease CtpA/Prc
MRRMTAGLVGAMLALAPMVAVAGPDEDRDDQRYPEQTYRSQDQDPNSSEPSEAYETSVGQPRLGIVVMGMTQDLRMYFAAPRDRGVLVARVEPNSLAVRAGIRVGDILIGVENRSVRSGDDVLQALSEAQRGERIRLYIVRERKPLRLDATTRPGATPYQPPPQPPQQPYRDPSGATST